MEMGNAKEQLIGMILKLQERLPEDVQKELLADVDLDDIKTAEVLISNGAYQVQIGNGVFNALSFSENEAIVECVTITQVDDKINNTKRKRSLNQRDGGYSIYNRETIIDIESVGIENKYSERVCCNAKSFNNNGLLIEDTYQNYEVVYGCGMVQDLINKQVSDLNERPVNNSYTLKKEDEYKRAM